MTDPTGVGATPRDIVRPLVRVRQYRQFTSEPPTGDQINAITDAARWSGSGGNSQPWRFVVIRSREALDRIREAGMPQTRSLATAPVAIAITMPGEDSSINAYDEGRAAERMLIAASLLGLGAGIAWITAPVRPAVSQILALPEDRFVRTIVVVGTPSEEARAPKAAPGTARLPREQTVFEERWPEG